MKTGILWVAAAVTALAGCAEPPIRGNDPTRDRIAAELDKAAAQRAKGAIEQYDGAPAVREALEILIESYDRLDLKELAEQSRQVYGTNFEGTIREAEAVEAALRGSAEVVALQGASAREPAVRQALSGKRYIHLATHGLSGGEALLAGLALTPPTGGEPSGDDDGFLQLHEIYGLTLDADLAVLSACGTNTGTIVAGEGVFALSRGFLVAGARRVVASQWPVDDASTAALMGDLFRRVAGTDPDYARALRDAKLRLRGSPAWADPFFWAPFVLTGAP